VGENGSGSCPFCRTAIRQPLAMRQTSLWCSHPTTSALAHRKAPSRKLPMRPSPAAGAAAERKAGRHREIKRWCGKAAAAANPPPTPGPTAGEAVAPARGDGHQGSKSYKGQRSYPGGPPTRHPRQGDGRDHSRASSDRGAPGTRTDNRRAQRKRRSGGGKSSQHRAGNWRSNLSRRQHGSRTIRNWTRGTCGVRSRRHGCSVHILSRPCGRGGAAVWLGACGCFTDGMG